MQTLYNQAIYIAVCLCIICSSCSEGSFTKIVEIPLSDNDAQLVVIANLNSHDDEQYILVSKTKSVLDNGEFESLSNATMNLSTPDKGVISLNFDVEKRLYALGDYTFISGENYTLEVDHPDFAPMKASITVPQSPEILDYDIELNDNFTFDNYESDVLKIKFKDPSGEVNNYKFAGRMYTIDSESNDTLENSYYFDLGDNLLEYNDNVISDITFNGKEYELILLGNRSYFSDSPGFKFVKIELDMLSLSEDVSLYDTSISQAYDAVDNPFVEPSTIYTNFDNGFGIFTVNNTQTIAFEF